LPAREFSAGIIPFREDGKNRKYLLLLSRLTISQLWEFPKGQIEKGEDPPTAALREFKEETGISDCKIISGYQKVLKYFYQRDGKLISKSVTYFLGRAGEGEVKLSRESKDFLWASMNVAVKKIRHKNIRQMLLEADQFLNETDTKTKGKFS
jgi:8-oxo-dGTP pyrophosphatase MutT (NUDIX family)